MGVDDHEPDLGLGGNASPTLATPETEAEFCLIRSALISRRS